MRIRLLTGSAMAVILVAALVLCAGGCGKTESGLLSEFKDMTEAAPTRQGLQDAVSFLDTSIEEVSEEGASRLVLAYEDYLLRYLSSNEPFDAEAPVADWFVIPPLPEESGPGQVDYQSLLERYGDRVSPELRELFVIKSLETSEPSTVDSQILRTYPDLLDRALKAETLLREHKSQDAVRANSLEYYKNYLFLLLAGSDLTPVFDYDTGVFSPEAQEAYEDFIAGHPDTVLAGVLTEYFGYLNSIGFQIDYSDPVESKVFYDTCDYLIEGALESF